MMHNSLFRRDLLRRMNGHPLVVARRNPHRNVGRRGKIELSPEQMSFWGEWTIECARNMPAERAVADDAADFLKRLGVTVTAGASRRLLLEIGSNARGFRVVVERERVEAHAADASALWAGWVSLEHEMRRAGGAVLRIREEERKPAWETQIAPPTWGTNYAVPDLSPEFVTDDTFRSLAHQGADGMLIYGDFLVYTLGTRFHELDHPGRAARSLFRRRIAGEDRTTGQTLRRGHSRPPRRSGRRHRNRPRRRVRMET